MFFEIGGVNTSNYRILLVDIWSNAFNAMNYKIERRPLVYNFKTLEPRFSQPVRTICHIVSSHTNHYAPSLETPYSPMITITVQMKLQKRVSVKDKTDLSTDLQIPTSAPHSPHYH